MARMTPRVQEGVLRVYGGQEEIRVGSSAWFSWLAEQRTFAYVSHKGSFTARRERRAAGWYWYAYRRRHGLLRSAYLGKVGELTCERLEEMAMTLGGTEQVAENGSERVPAQRYLLTTKLIAPALPSMMIARPRLTAYLQKRSAQICVVTAPAGAGKTTLLSEWVRECDCATGWLVLDEGDNDLARFWCYTLAAIQRCFPGMGLHLLTLLPTLQAENWEPFLTLLINALAGLPGEFVLLLDNYHCVSEPAVQASVAFLIEYAPPQLRLMFASRNPVSLPLPRLRARGVLVEIGFDELRFTQQEARELYSHLIECEIAEDELAHLLAYTEGWVTGLILATRSGMQRKVSIAASRRSQQELFAYFASEVMAYLPEDIHTFLLDCSILERFNSALCDAVMERNDSQMLLRQLEQEHLFFTHSEQPEGWYRWQQLCAEFLREQLEQRYVGRSEEVQRRAATWFEQQNMPVEAIDYALRARDFARAARWIEEQGREVLKGHELTVLRAWLRALPEEIVAARPRLCIYVAWTLLHTTSLQLVEEYLSQAERSLRDDTGEEEMRRALYGEIEAIRARVAIYQNRIEQGVVSAYQALNWLAESDEALRGEVMQSLGTVQQAVGETAEAENMYRQAIESSKKCGNLRTRMLAMRSLGILYMERGELRRAYKLYLDGLEYAEETEQGHLPPVGFMYVGLAELCYEWNDLETAEQYVQKGIELGRLGGDVKIWVLGYINLLFIYMAGGDSEQGWSLLDETERLVRQTQFMRGLAWLKQIRPLLRYRQGDNGPLLDWEEECELSPDVLPDIQRQDEYQQLARALLVRLEVKPALRILQNLLKLVERSGQTGYKISLLLDLARAYELEGKEGRMREALTEALTLAEAGGYLRTVLDSGAVVMVLLSKLYREARKEGEACVGREESGSISSRWWYEKRRRPRGTALREYLRSALFKHDRAAVPLEKLSQREGEVISLLAQGYGNAEIAEQLVIGLNTVKTHLKNIYGKLGARNRLQAVAYARVLYPDLFQKG